MTAEQRASIEEDIRIARAFADDEEAQEDMRKWQAALAELDARSLKIITQAGAIAAHEDNAADAKKQLDAQADELRLLRRVMRGALALNDDAGKAWREWRQKYGGK